MDVTDEVILRPENLPLFMRVRHALEKQLKASGIVFDSSFGDRDGNIGFIRLPGHDKKVYPILEIEGVKVRFEKEGLTLRIGDDQGTFSYDRTNLVDFIAFRIISEAQSPSRTNIRQIRPRPRGFLSALRKG